MSLTEFPLGGSRPSSIKSIHFWNNYWENIGHPDNSCQPRSIVYNIGLLLGCYWHVTRDRNSQSWGTPPRSWWRRWCWWWSPQRRTCWGRRGCWCWALSSLSLSSDDHYHCHHLTLDIEPDVMSDDGGGGHLALVLTTVLCLSWSVTGDTFFVASKM